MNIKGTNFKNILPGLGINRKQSNSQCAKKKHKKNTEKKSKLTTLPTASSGFRNTRDLSNENYISHTSISWSEHRYGYKDNSYIVPHCSLLNINNLYESLCDPHLLNDTRKLTIA